MIPDIVTTVPGATSSAVSSVTSSVVSFLGSALSDLQLRVDVMPRALQVLAVFLLSVIPVVEGDIAAGIGMVAGVDWEFTFLAAAGGTALSAWAAAVWGSRLAARRRTRSAGPVDEMPDEVTPARKKAAARVLDRVDRYGLGPAMVLCGFVSPVALNTFVLALAGVDRRRLVFWGTVSALVNVGAVVAGTGGILHLLLH